MHDDRINPTCIDLPMHALMHAIHVSTNPTAILVTVSWMYPEQLFENKREARGVENALNDCIDVTV